MWTQKKGGGKPGKSGDKEKEKESMKGGRSGGGGGIVRKCSGWQKWPGGVAVDGKFMLGKDECWKCGEFSSHMVSPFQPLSNFDSSSSDLQTLDVLEGLLLLLLPRPGFVLSLLDDLSLPQPPLL